MGFKLQKRIKLGKNLGLNVSKSGISPSYRTKKGTISTKGFSVRTGIKGVTYRKSFAKTKQQGCLLTLLLFLFAIVLFSTK